MGLTAKERAELRRQRSAELYAYQEEVVSEFSGTPSEGPVIGLDEVGRGPLAGPLTVAAVCLPAEPLLSDIDDSKKLTPARREKSAAEIAGVALGIGMAHIQPAEIDAAGMSASLRVAFSRALASCLADLSEHGVAAEPRAVLVDGRPLSIHPREHALVKGDSSVASIAAASIVAKVARDAIMDALAEEHPGYGWESNKGYGTAAHIAAIRELGPTDLHRKSFLGNILSS